MHTPRLAWIRPEDPPESFPDVRVALRDPDGLLAVGGDLAPARLLYAYRHGIFPWFHGGQPILWWSPDPRMVLFPENFRVSRSLRRTLRQNKFHVTSDTAFEEVLMGCAGPRTGQPEGGTWITPEMQQAYLDLHRSGHAHSVEVWSGGKLVGGLYGVALGRVFFGESMFSRMSDASKVALAHLVQALLKQKFALIDCQVHTAHLQSLGACPIPRAQFLQLLMQHCEPDTPVRWPLDFTTGP